MNTSGGTHTLALALALALALTLASLPHALPQDPRHAMVNEPGTPTLSTRSARAIKDGKRKLDRYTHINPYGSSKMVLIPINFNGCVLHGFQPEKGQAFEKSAIETVVHELYVGSPNCVFFGIFEGHGPNAKEVVYFVSERLPAEVSSLAADGSKTFQECFDIAFVDVEKELVASDIDVKSSGCTCCCIVMEVGRLVEAKRESD